MNAVWTPQTKTGKRLSFPRESVEFLTVAPRERNGKGRVRIDGKEYNYRSASCGLNCYCDAVLIGYEPTSPESEIERVAQ